MDSDSEPDFGLQIIHVKRSCSFIQRTTLHDDVLGYDDEEAVEHVGPHDEKRMKSRKTFLKKEGDMS